MSIKKEHYHTIRSQEFAISLEEEAHAYEIQSEISSIQHTQIENIINNVLNQFSDDRYIFRFDQIELNLGTILAESLTQDMPLKIEETLTQYLQNALNDYSSSSIFEKIEVYDTLIEQLEHFLLYGYFNWNTYTNTSATTLFEELKNNNKESLKLLLQKLGKAENIRKRIINQFLDSTIEGIVEVVAEEESSYILEYRTAIINHQQNERIIESETNVFRNALWEIILAYIFLESNSYYNKKNYLGYLIKKIAEKYNQTYASLLLALYIGIDSTNLPNRGRQNDFKKIVSELKNESVQIAEIWEETTEFNVSERLQLEQLLTALFISKSTFYSIKITKNQLLNRIHFYIKNDSKFVQFVTKKLLSIPETRILFLSFLDVHSFNALFEKIATTKMQWSLTLFENLYHNRLQLTTLSQSSFIELFHQRKKFAILHLLHFSESKESLIQNTINSIIDEIYIQKSDALIWLLRSVEQFLGADKKIVLDYVKKQFGYDQIIEISQEIKQFVTSNEPETWHYWLETNHKKWIKLLQLKGNDWEYLVSKELKKELQSSIYSSLQPIIKRVSSTDLDWQSTNSSSLFSDWQPTNQTKEELKNFLNLLIENLSISIQDISLETHYSEKWYSHITELIIETAITFSIDKKQLIAGLLLFYTKNKPNELIAWRLEKLQKNNFSVSSSLLNQHSQLSESVVYCEYVIENGILPWWNTAYSWKTLNTQLAIGLQDIAYNKQLVTAFTKSSSGLTVVKQLTSTNQRDLFYGLLNWNSAATSQRWLRELFDFISVEAFLSGSIPNTYYKEFTFQLVVLLLSEKPSAITVEKKVLGHIVQLLKKVSKSNSYDANRIVQIIYSFGDTQLLKRCATHKEFKEFWKFYLIENKNVSISSLSAYLSNANSTEIKAILNQEKVILQALQSTEIRKLLVSKLSCNDILLLLSFWSKTPYFDQLSRAIILLQVAHNTDLTTGKMQLLDVFTSNLLLSKTIQNTYQNLIEYNSLHWLQSIIKLGKLRSFLEPMLKNKEGLSPYLIHFFEKEETRDLLIQELSTKEIVTVIKSRLSPNQVSFFDRSLKVLNYYFHYVSPQEKSQLNKLFFGLILSKISTLSTLQSWNVQNWMWLVNYCLEKTTSNSKKNQLLVKIVDTKLQLSETKKELLVLIEIAQKKDSINLLDSELISKVEKPYKKLGEEIPKELLNPIYIKHAGLIILAPYLKMLFEKCQLFTPLGEFKDSFAKQKAIHLLEFAAFGHNEYHEHDLVINKVLCGIELSETINRKIVLTETEKDTVNSLLKAVTQQWSALKETSITGLRETFLQRFGRLEEEEEQYYLKVEKKAFDMLLDQIPWNISTIKLSWMKKILIVEWR